MPPRLTEIYNHYVLNTTVTFDAEQGKTRLTLRHGPVPSGAQSEGAKQGWSESLDKLAANLAKC